MSPIDGVNPHGALAAFLARALGHEVTPKGTEDDAPAVGETEADDDGTVVVQITLTEDAENFLTGDGPGKSGQSSAHRAKAMLDSEEYASLSNLPFGRIVSTLARTGSIDSLLPPEPEPEPDVVADTEAVVDAEATVVADTLDLTDPSIAETENVIAAGDETAAADLGVIAEGTADADTTAALEILRQITEANEDETEPGENFTLPVEPPPETA